MDNLPVEVLQMIFNYFSGREALNYRNVCNRWKDCIEGLSDDFWREACLTDHSETWREAHRKSNLPWFHLYESLSLWRDVAIANITTKVIPDLYTHHLQVLGNNKISVPSRIQSSRDYNTIAYYDLATLIKCQQENTSHFNYYLENDNMILFVDKHNNVTIAVKPDMTLYSVGKLISNALEINVDLVLLEKEAYFKDTDYNLIICKLVEKNNEKIIQVRNFGHFYELIRTVKRINKKAAVNIMTVEGYILRIEDDSDMYDELCFLSKYKDNVYLAEKCGFKWSSRDTLGQILSYDDPASVPACIKKFKSPIVCSFGNILIIGTHQNRIHIFETKLQHSSCSSASSSDDSCFDDVFGHYDIGYSRGYSCKKLLSINLEEEIQSDLLANWSQKKIRMIEVVETVKGHNMIILYGSQVIILELSHTEPKKITKILKNLKKVRKAPKVLQDLAPKSPKKQKRIN